ncbi:MAG: hypothetical protein ACREDR_34930 [Blastocatellia bacterium]
MKKIDVVKAAEEGITNNLENKRVRFDGRSLIVKAVEFFTDLNCGLHARITGRDGSVIEPLRGVEIEVED